MYILIIVQLVILKKQLESRKFLDEAELSSEKKLTLSSECLISRKMSCFFSKVKITGK
jgi:hypothetical protein